MSEDKYETFQKEFESFLKTTEAKSKSDIDEEEVQRSSELWI
jgi:hypothetical protein